MKLKLYFLAFPFFLLACNRGPGFIEGHILEEQYIIPIENVNVEVYEANNFSGSHDLVGQVKTDINGQFRIDFHYNPKNQYELEISSPKLHQEKFKTLIMARETTKDIILPTITNLKFKITNNQANDVFLTIRPDNGLYFNMAFQRIKAKSDFSFSGLNVKAFGQTAFSYSVVTDQTQNPVHIVHDTISVLTRKDTVIQLIEIN